MLKTEASEQLALAKWLDAIGVLWFHPVNEGRRSLRQGAQLKARGMKAGVPDIIILSCPPAASHVRGVAIELKRLGGKVSANQDIFMRKMRSCEWLTQVCYGAEQAIAYLQALGYGYPAPDPED